MAYKINIRNSGNDGWVNLLQAQYVSVLDTGGNFTGTDVEAVLLELFNTKASRVEAAVAPTSTDDGYQTGTVWVNTASDSVYICVDNTASTAIWNNLDSTSSEEVQDIVGAMVGGTSSQSGIAVTYTDNGASDGVLDFNVDDFTLTLGGDLTGNVTITDLASNTLTAAVVNDSHTHDTQYFTQNQVTDGFVNIDGDTMTGALTISSSLTLNAGAGVNEFSVDGTFGDNSDTAVPTEQAVKTYVDSMVYTGIDWQDSVITMTLSTPPASAGLTAGDRYIILATGTGDWAGHDDQITEWNGTAWEFVDLSAGQSVFVEDEDRYYVYNDTNSWVALGTVVQHNSLTGLQGGVSTEYFHLTSAEHTALTGSKTANYVFAAPNGSAGVLEARPISSAFITDFDAAAQDATGLMVGGGSVQTGISVTFDDTNNELDFVVDVATVTTQGIASFDDTYFSVTAGVVSLDNAPITDHGDLTGLEDDDHTQYVHVSTARSITAQHTFAPASAIAPFVLNSNAQGVLVTGLNADLLDGQHWGSSATSASPPTTIANDIWVEITA